MEQTLGRTAPKIRHADSADLWTWLIIAVRTPLRLARPLAEDLHHPWERPAEPRRLTPPELRGRSYRSRYDRSPAHHHPDHARPGTLVLLPAGPACSRATHRGWRHESDLRHQPPPRTPLRRFPDREMSAGPEPLRENSRARYATEPVLMPPTGALRPSPGRADRFRRNG